MNNKLFNFLFAPNINNMTLFLFTFGIFGSIKGYINYWLMASVVIIYATMTNYLWDKKEKGIKHG